MKQIKGFFWIAVIIINVGCYPAHPAPTTVSVQVSTELPRTETSTPACTEVPGVEIKVVPTSVNAVNVNITGLAPYEPVQFVLYSEVQGHTKRIECCAGETANEKGSYEFSTGLRGQDWDVEFKDWQVQAIYPRGVACTNFSLP